MLVFGAIVIVTGLLFTRVPTSFLPPEDPGFAYGQVQTPPGASKERTWAALDKAQQYLLNEEKDVVDGVLTVNGFNFAGTGQNSGLIFIKLKNWDERKTMRSPCRRSWRAPTSSSRASPRRTSLRCRRRRCWSSAIPPASISCCRTAVACRTRTSWPRATSC